MNTILTILLLFPMLLAAQTKTTVALDKKYEGMSLYFYKNTLRMLNQNDDKDFDELIKDIEKMRFVMINKNKERFESAQYAALKKAYQSETYQEVMTGRFDGRNFDVFVKEVNGDVKGTVILASDSSSLYVLDVLGKVALNKVSALFNTIDGSTDIGAKIRDFANGEAEEKKKQKQKKENDKEAEKNN
jgi:hypothetical protein